PGSHWQQTRCTSPSSNKVLGREELSGVSPLQEEGLCVGSSCKPGFKKHCGVLPKAGD
ncbi:hypothetical protein AAFF_G00132110, partial [Aldrovandia affinis]